MAKSCPRIQAVSAPEHTHVIPDFHQQQGGTNGIHSRQGLEQCQSVLLWFQTIQQSGVEAGDPCFQRFVMVHDFVQNTLHSTYDQMLLVIACLIPYHTTVIQWVTFPLFVRIQPFWQGG